MVRKLLGNIKGSQGPQGPRGVKGDTGEKGSFENLSIGVINKIDISNLVPRGGNASYDYDLENGVINYENIEWYLTANSKLNGVMHAFRIEDFVSNPDYSSGRINLQIHDSNSNIVVNEFIIAKEIYSIDLTGRATQDYQIQLRVTNTTLFSGYIEKPMLAEAEYPVVWNYNVTPVKPEISLVSKTYNMTIPVTTEPTVLNSLNIQSNKGFNVADGVFTIPETGLYAFTCEIGTASFSGVEGFWTLYFYLNDEIYHTTVKDLTTIGNLVISHTMPFSSGDTIDFRLKHTDTVERKTTGGVRSLITISAL